MIKKTGSFFILLIIVNNSTCRFYDLYDSLIYMPYNNKGHKNTIFSQVFCQYQDIHGYGEKEYIKNPFQLFDQYENSLASLEGFDSQSPQAQLLTQLDVTQDGRRGMLLFDGSLRMQWGTTVGIIIPFTPHWSFQSFLGLYHFKLKNFAITDQTQNTSIDDTKTKELFTDTIITNAQKLGGKLLLQDWAKTGLGDWNNYLIWQKSFEQKRFFLQEVTIALRTGILIPICHRNNNNYLLQYSYGNDGALGIPFGAGLKFQCNNYLALGIDFELLHLFGFNQKFRFKTSSNQTNLLLLAKEEVYKENGLQQKLDLYLQFSDIQKIFFATVGYHYHKAGDDSITIRSENFPYNIANQTKTLYDSTAHHVIVSLGFDTSTVLKKVCLQGNLFLKQPFNGSNRLVGGVIGFGLSINF